MNLFKKNIIFLLLGFLLFSCGFVSAQTLPDKFIVDISPDSFDINEAVDVTVKAVLNDGTTVKDYEADIWMDVEWVIDTTDSVVPSDHIYPFHPEDQWVKLFSKGLMIKVPGTYKFVVMDLLADDIKWEATIIVDDSTEDVWTSAVDIISPVDGGVETNFTIEVLADAVDLPNTPYQVLLNDFVQYESVTTEMGHISAYLTGAQDWQNVLEIRIIDINGVVLWKSQKITFNYKSSLDDIFQGIELSNSSIKQWEKITFNVNTNEDVTSVEMRLSNGQSFPMDRITAWTFTKQILAENAGAVNVSLSAMVAGNVKIYSDVASYTVQEYISIGNIKVVTDVVDKSSVMVSWDPVGSVSNYKVEYWTNPDALTFSQNVITNEIKLQNLNPEQKYYIKISPLDMNGNLIGIPSEVQEIQPGHLGPTTDGGDEDVPTCVIKNIDYSTWMIGDKYYLTWSEVENVEKYIVYKSDWLTSVLSDMNKVWETTDTRFEYWFDTNTRRHTYSYFVVQAICSDGSAVQIGNVKKVHVGPVDDLLLFIVVLLFLYMVYKLYKSSLLVWE